MGLMIIYQYFFINCDKHTIISKEITTEETEHGAYANYVLASQFFWNFHATIIKNSSKSCASGVDRVGWNVTSMRP